MPDTADQSHQARPPSPIWRWGVRLLALACLGLSVYLMIVALSQAQHPPGCGPQSGCEKVLGSRWSSWLGIPVGALACGVYAGILMATFFLQPTATPRQRRAAWWALVVLAVMILGSVAWFMTLQLWVIQATCPYCLAAHAIGAVTALMVLAQAPIAATHPTTPTPRHPVRIAPLGAAGLAMIGLVGVGAIAAGQLLVPPPPPPGFTQQIRESQITTPNQLPATQPPAAEKPQGTPNPVVAPQPPEASVTTRAQPGPPAAPAIIPDGSAQASNPHTDPIPPSTQPETATPTTRQLSILDGKVTLRPHKLPMRGSPDAKVILVYLFDYTCPHCRKMHRYYEQALTRYGDQLAMIMMPVPLNPRCNPMMKHDKAMHRWACEYARLALGVWRTDPNAFAGFDTWLSKPYRPPPIESARQFAQDLVGAKALQAALADPWVKKQIARDIEIYRTAGSGYLPKTVAGNLVLTGSAQSVQQVYDVFEKKLGFPPTP